MADLNGKNIAIIATNGFEDSELTSPKEAVESAGATTKVVSTETGEIEGKKGAKVAVDAKTADASVDEFDALILPGGTINADTIRTDADAVALVKAFKDAGKPIGVICHGGWILADADLLKGVKLTSVANVKTDLANAGANWVDEEVVVDSGFISSRTPDDLPAFNATIVDMEGYALAAVCSTFGVPLTLLKQVSDSADESASEVWEAALERARVELEQALRDHLR